MSSLELFEEPIPDTGGINAEGALKPLGAVAMNKLSLLLREAVQNSWDARITDGSSKVEFLIEYNTLTEAQKNVFREKIFHKVPKTVDPDRWLNNEQATMFICSDRNTKGLNGALIPREAKEKEEKNFIDFVWTIGRSADKKSGAGGTYGYGKTAFFLTSAIRTICIHTRCIHKGKAEERLILAHLGKQNTASNLTGRCWWGKKDGMGVLPLLDEEASTMAAQMGLPAFGSDEYGTSIAVLGSPFSDEDMKDVEDRDKKLSDLTVYCLLLWFWPKMTRIGGADPEMNFRLKINGNETKVPRPEHTTPFNIYSAALSNLLAEEVVDDDDTPEKKDIKWRNNLIGEMGFSTALAQPRSIKPTEDYLDGGLAERSHHAALLRRDPLIVVKYLVGDKHTIGSMEYAAVFVAEESETETFAKSEPPTHDDWVPNQLEDKNEKSKVKVTLDRIRSALREFLSPCQFNPDDMDQPPLGHFSNEMGGLLGGTRSTGGRVTGGLRGSHGIGPGTGAGTGVEEGSHGTGEGAGTGEGTDSGEGNGGAGTLGQPVAQIKRDEQKLVIRNNQRCARFPFAVHFGDEKSAVSVRANPFVVLDGGDKEKKPPPGASLPSVVGYVSNTSTYLEGDVLEVKSEDSGETFSVDISMPEDFLMDLTLTLEKVTS